MLGVILAVVALIAWGTADIFGGIVARKTNGYSVAVWYFLLDTILASPLLFIFKDSLRQATINDLLLLLMLGIIAIISVMIFYEAMKKGNAAVNGTIASAYNVVSTSIAVIFLKTHLASSTAIFILLVLIGMVLVSINFKSTSVKEILKDKGIPYSLTAWLLWGIYYAFVKIPISRFNWFIPAYATWLAFPIGIIFMQVRKIPLKTPPTTKLKIYQLVVALLAMIGVFAFNYALLFAPIPIVVGISSGYPLLFVVLASLIFKDKLDTQQKIGLAIGLLGIVGLGFVG